VTASAMIISGGAGAAPAEPVQAGGAVRELPDDQHSYAEPPI